MGAAQAHRCTIVFAVRNKRAHREQNFFSTDIGAINYFFKEILTTTISLPVPSGMSSLLAAWDAEDALIQGIFDHPKR